jgi:formylmethanofuran dehydrogenase subunit B
MPSAVTCPFCGLACGDLILSDVGLDTRGCERASAGFARAKAPQRPHAIAGKPARLEAAVDAAADILRAASMPVFHGLAADLNAIRAVLALAERVGGTFDHMVSAPLLTNAAVARASGWVTATLAEVANRADFILMVGSDPQRNFPRFYERLIQNPAPLYREGSPVLAYIGPEQLAPPDSVARLRAILGEGELLAGLATLNVLLRDRRPGSAHGDLPLEALTEMARRLRDARYGVIAWDISMHEPTVAELAVEYLCEALRHLNAKTRCVGLPLGGSGNSLGAMQVALWQTGWPLRTSFASGAPEHDPHRHNAVRTIASGEADALVWISTLAAEPPPRSSTPLIAIVADDIELPEPAAVEFRVGIPGIDHAGEVVRTDAVIAVPLQATHPSGRPSAAQVARAILDKLETAR